MQYLRFAPIAVFAIVPVAIVGGFGVVSLWETGWLRWLWLPMLGSMIAVWLLVRRETRRFRAEAQVVVDIPMTWTETDRLAGRKIEEFLADKPSPEELIDMTFYAKQAQTLSRSMVSFYRPGAEPFDPLTIPEMLTLMELVAGDLHEEVVRMVPGSHLLSVSHLRRAVTFVDYWKQAMNAYWAVSAFINPLETGLRWLGSQVGVSRPMKDSKNQIIGWFYALFIRRMGFYLIELYSGRLKVGASRYRELREIYRQSDPDGPAAEPLKPLGEREDPADAKVEEAPNALKLVVVGQVNVGKSSLVNFLLGDRKADVDSVPMTEGVTRYLVDEGGERLAVYDTPGYQDSDETRTTKRERLEALQGADLILLVSRANMAARQADRELIQQMHEWFAEHPRQKKPAMLAVLTHVDLLSPVMEWQPPYDPAQGTRPKEVTMRAATDAFREQLGEHVEAVVPVCLAEGRQWNRDGLGEAIRSELDESRGVALTRLLHLEGAKPGLGKVLEQGKEAAVEAMKLVRGLFGKK